MDPNDLRSSIRGYENQLEQIKLAISVTTDGPEKDDLLNLRGDIQQLIRLTKESLDKLTDVGPSTSKENAVDDEYLLFMEEMAKEGAVDRPDVAQTDVDQDLKSLEGMKCQAPHSHSWGDTVYHNALVFGVVPSQEEQNFDDIQVRVMFTNPTHQEMMPCPYFLETTCKFSDEKCKFSHGQVVSLSSLQEYKEPNFGGLRNGSRVLAKHSKGLWHRAIVKKVTDENCTVKFESSQNPAEIDLKDVLPLDDDSDSDSESDNSSSETDGSGSDRDRPSIQQSLLTMSSQTMGDWEKYTKGIGSKLMQQMGYVIGTGLGKCSDGRTEPVDAVVLPPGKSLDHCMELRENAGGDENLFSVERRLKKQKKRIEAQNKRVYENEKKKKDIFEFLNNSLTLSKDTKSNGGSKIKYREGIKTGTTRDLNVAGMKIEEDMKRVELDMIKIKQALVRHNNADTQINKNLRCKLQNKADELNELRVCAKNVTNEQNQRKDKKKMTVF